MSKKRIWVGIDASRDAAALCVTTDAGEIIKEGIVAPVARDIAHELKPLKRRREMVVGIEAGDVAIALIRDLLRLRFDVRVLETRAVKKFLEVRQNKTDRNDARGIAEVARLGGATVPEVLLKSVECQRLRSELVLRSQLMRQRIATENAIRAVLRINGAKLGCGRAGRFSVSARSELRRLRTAGNDLAELLDPVISVVDLLRETIDQITKRIERLVRKHEVCCRLMTVPGVGPISALSFYTAVQDPDRFKRSDDVAPYLGLVPKVIQSGTSSHHGRITKKGSKMTRAHLVTAAVSLMQSRNRENPILQWALAVAERRGRPKARVALAKKLAIVMLAIWKSGAVWSPQKELRRTDAGSGQ